MNEDVKNALRLAKSRKSKEKAMPKELESFYNPEAGSRVRRGVLKPGDYAPDYGTDAKRWREKRGAYGREEGYNPWADPENMYTHPSEERHDPKDPMYSVSPEEYRKGIYGRGVFALESGGRVGRAEGGANMQNDVAAEITDAYYNTLGRAPDEVGLNYWTRQAQQGMPLFQIIDTLGKSQEARDFQASQVPDFYRDFLGREPDAEGLAFFQNAIKSGNANLADVENVVVSSPEAQQYASFAGPITSVFQTYLGREPTQEDLNAIPRNYDLNALVESVSSSPEAQNALNQQVEAAHQQTGQPRQEIAASISLSRRNKKHAPSPKATEADVSFTLPNTIYDKARDMWDNGSELIKSFMPGLIGQEGGSKGWEAKASTSSAQGPFQFLTGTWNANFAKNFGSELGITAADLGHTVGKRYVPTPLGKKIAALRTDTSPQGKALTMAMGLRFNEDNAKMLEEEGLPVTQPNLYSVHFSGNTNLAREFTKNPNAPVSAALNRQQLNANRSFAGKTVGQVMNTFQRYLESPDKIGMGEKVLAGYQEARNLPPTPTADPGLTGQPKTPTTTPTTTAPKPGTGPFGGYNTLNEFLESLAPPPPPPPANYQEAVAKYKQDYANWEDSVRRWQIADAAMNNGRIGPVPAMILNNKPTPPNPADWGSPSGGEYRPEPPPPESKLQPINVGAGTLVNPLPNYPTPAPITNPSPTPMPGTTGSNFTPQGTVQPITGGGFEAMNQNVLTGLAGPGAIAGPGAGVNYGIGTGGGLGTGAPSGLPAITFSPAPVSPGFGVSYMNKGGVVEDALRIAKARGGAWTRKEGKNPEGGLNEKGRASLRAQGHDIKRPQPEGGSRRDSFCARMKGMKAKLTSAETANDPDSRINKSLRKWNCADGGVIEDALRLAKGGRPIWDKSRPKSLGKSEPLSSKQKASAKAAAKAAGRPYPNLVDNMRAAQRKK